MTARPGPRVLIGCSVWLFVSLPFNYFLLIDINKVATWSCKRAGLPSDKLGTPKHQCSKRLATCTTALKRCISFAYRATKCFPGFKSVSNSRNLSWNICFWPISIVKENLSIDTYPDTPAIDDAWHNNHYQESNVESIADKTISKDSGVEWTVISTAYCAQMPNYFWLRGLQT